MPNITPFFQAFGPLLFGRGPGSQIGKVKRLGSLGELCELFGEFLPDRLLSMSEEGANSRDRIFTPKVSFWAFVSQVLDVGSASRDGSPVSFPCNSPPPPRWCASDCPERSRRGEAWWRWMQKDRTEEPALSPSNYC